MFLLSQSCLFPALFLDQFLLCTPASQEALCCSNRGIRTAPFSLVVWEVCHHIVCCGKHIFPVSRAASSMEQIPDWLLGALRPAGGSCVPAGWCGVMCSMAWHGMAWHGGVCRSAWLMCQLVWFGVLDSIPWHSLSSCHLPPARHYLSGSGWEAASV